MSSDEQSIQLRGRYDVNGEVCLEGTTIGLALFAECIGTQETWINLIVPETTPAPYTNWLFAVCVREQPGKVKILRVDDRLMVLGERAYLKTIARNLEGLSKDDHLHIEYYPGHFYLDPGSVPLVVECTDQF